MGTEHRRYPDAESSQKPIAHEPAVAEAVAEAVAKAVAEAVAEAVALAHELMRL